jgi:hypothetical protein
MVDITFCHPPIPGLFPNRSFRSVSVASHRCLWLAIRHPRRTAFEIFTRGYDNLLHLLFTLVYPVMLLLLGRAIFSKYLQRWELPLLHLLLALSFAVIWYYVLNGYDFMPG